MEILKTLETTKGYKVSIGYFMDNTLYDDYSYFGDWYKFYFKWRMERATSKELMEEVDDEMIDMIFWNYEFSEDDICGYEEYTKEKAENLNKKYWIYPVRVYEHTDYAFHLWNTKDWDWVMLLDKELMNERDTEDLEHFLNGQFTDFFNGRLYEIMIQAPHKYKDDEGEEITLWDYKDWIWAVMRDELEETYKDMFMEECWQLIWSFN